MTYTYQLSLTSYDNTLWVLHPLSESSLSKGTHPGKTGALVIVCYGHCIFVTLLLLLKTNGEGTANSMAQPLTL